jgi:hypothetical protein
MLASIVRSSRKRPDTGGHADDRQKTDNEEQDSDYHREGDRKAALAVYQSFCHHIASLIPQPAHELGVVDDPDNQHAHPEKDHGETEILGRPIFERASRFELCKKLKDRESETD